MKRIVVVILLFLLFSSLLIISNNEIYLFEKGGLTSFGNAYLSWLVFVGSNIFSITSNVVVTDSKNNSST